MIGIVVVSHGRLAVELRAAMEHVVGAQRGVATVCIDPDDDVEAKRAEIVQAVQSTDTGDGVVIATDMFGGTPSNLAMSLLPRPGLDVLVGVNLPMLVKLAKSRSHHPLGESVACAEEAGHKYMGAASRMGVTGAGTNTCCGGTAAPALPTSAAA